ncbi:unnamed protein product [Brassica oleracea]
MDLSPAKTTWKIKVKIIRLWRQYSTGDIDSIEMVLINSNGDTIHATVNEDVVPIFESFLEEGDSKIFINFSLSQACGSYRLTKHPYKIWFQATTRIRLCDDLPYRLTGFTHVNFREILDGTLSPEYLIDIVSQIVEVTHMSEAYVMHTMCLPCPLIHLLKRLKLLPNCYQRKTYLWQLCKEEDYFVKTPQKTISDILETRKVERCYVRCTIAAIDNDMGWYYISCKVCGTKVDMLHNNVHSGGTYELDVRCMLYCTKCKMLNPKLKLRY